MVFGKPQIIPFNIGQNESAWLVIEFEPQGDRISQFRLDLYMVIGGWGLSGELHGKID
jgi:hypothetical protein